MYQTQFKTFVDKAPALLLQFFGINLYKSITAMNIKIKDKMILAASMLIVIRSTPQYHNLQMNTHEL